MKNETVHSHKKMFGSPHLVEIGTWHTWCIIVMERGGAHSASPKQGHMGGTDRTSRFLFRLEHPGSPLAVRLALAVRVTILPFW